MILDIWMQVYGDPLKLIRGLEVWTWTNNTMGGGINIPSTEAKLLKPNFPHNCLSLGGFLIQTQGGN